MDPAALTGLFDQLRIGSQGLVLVFGTDDFVIRARRSGNKEISGATLLADSLFRKALKENSVGSFEAVMPIDGIKVSGEISTHGFLRLDRAAYVHLIDRWTYDAESLRSVEA
jgi:hypothetical protein